MSGSGEKVERGGHGGWTAGVEDDIHIPFSVDFIFILFHSILFYLRI